MEIKMHVAVPIEALHATVKFFEKHQIKMKSTEFIPDGYAKKKRKVFLTDAQRKEIAGIKSREFGQQAAVAAKYNVAPSVIGRIWSGQ